MFPQGSLYSLAQQGFVWSADAQTSSVLALNTYVRFKMSNPSGSGRTIAIYCLGVYANSNAMLSVYKNPSTTVITNTVSPVCTNMSSTNTSVAQVAWDTSSSAMAGTFVRRYGVSANTPNEFSKEIYILNPGDSIGMAAYLTLALNNQAQAHLSWVEIQ